jgi:hypothetical protein
MTPQEYREVIDKELELGLMTLDEYNKEVAALRFAEQVIKD